MNKYDVIIIGAGPGGIFAAYELMQKAPRLKVAVYESGNPLEKRKCPIDGKKVKSCINCKTCAIMSGFGGAGAFSDGKYNITNDFGGTLYEYIGKDTAISLMHYVDEINVRYGGEGTKMYSTAGTKFKKLCMQNKLKLLDASVRHLGTDINYVVLENIFKEFKSLLHSPIKHITDCFSFILNFQCFTIVSLAFAHLTWHKNIWQEIHLNLFDACAFANFTPTA